MILEAIVTTLGPDGAANVAPMGPRLFAPYELRLGTRFLLRPFATSRTYANLTAHPEGVLHVHDDVLLLARAAVGEVRPATVAARVVRGAVLPDACRAYEFRVVERDGASPREGLTAEVAFAHDLRPFFGLNRAMAAVVEAAILATRVGIVPAEQIRAEYERLAVPVEKTAGEREREAFELLRRYVEGKDGGSKETSGAREGGEPRA